MLVFSVLWSIVICLAITAPAQAADRVIVKFSWLAMSDMQSLGPLFADPLSACKQEVDYYNAPRSSRGFGYNNVRTLSNGGCLADYFNYYLYISLPLRPFPLIYPDQQLPWATRIYQCPTNSVYYLTAADHVECACKAGYGVDAFGTACVLKTACPAGQVVHPEGGCMLDCSTQLGTHPNLNNTACVLNSSCPIPTVKPLTSLPTEATDPCSAALESQSSSRIATDCPKLTPEMQNEMDCLGEKLRLKGITMKVTAKVRTLAYQRHFREVWENMEKLIEKTADDAVLQAACATTRAELAAEKGCDNAGACKSCTGSPAHCLKAQPAKPDPMANHPKGKAIDIKAANVKALLSVLNTPPPQTMQQFLDEPVTPPPPATACATPKLKWGGLWHTNPDKVHFYLP